MKIIESVFIKEISGPTIIDNGYNDIKIKKILFLSIVINFNNCYLHL